MGRRGRGGGAVVVMVVVVGGGLQQPAGQFSTGNWWPQRGGVRQAWSGERWAGLKRVRGILGSASRQRGLSLGSLALVSIQNCTCGSSQTADLNLCCR